jgi:hypothetical protein
MNEIKEIQTTLNNIGNDEDILKEKICYWRNFPFFKRNVEKC